MNKQPAFDHEKLDVYRLAIEFARWVGELLDGPLESCSAKTVEHLDESSRSVARNIAEGNGKQRVQGPLPLLRHVARFGAGVRREPGVALEKDGLVARKRLGETLAWEGKAMLVRIVSMLVKLIDRLLGPEEFG